MERFRNATPEERRRMMNERMVEMATRTYELSEDQKVRVRTEIEAIQAERRSKMGPLAEEHDRLREEMGNFWMQQPPPDVADRGEWFRARRESPEFQRIRDRMREIDRQFPFDFRASLERVEKLLPPEQAERGRARMEEFRNRMPADGQGPGEFRRGRGRGGDEEGDALRRAQRQRRGNRDRRFEERNEANRPAPPPPPGAALHPWEQYVRQFIASKELSDTQSASAMAILKELRTRAEQIEKSIAEDLERANRIEDAAARARRISELRKPIEQLFEELKSRLNALLTESQRSGVRV